MRIFYDIDGLKILFLSANKKNCNINDKQHLGKENNK